MVSRLRHDHHLFVALGELLVAVTAAAATVWQREVEYQFGSDPAALETATASVVVPRRSLVCSRDAAPCRLVLNVTAMATMTFYEHHGDGQRSAHGYRAGIDGGSTRLTIPGGNHHHGSRPEKNITRFLHPIVADGHPRAVYVVNNQLPGPVIVAYRGQQMEITVLNNLPQTLTMHWHGQHLVGAPWADGVASVTQCTIQPGNSYVYNFTTNQVGTHWYHAHDAGERTDGVYGGLVIKDTAAATTYADVPETNMMLVTDWFEDDWNVTFRKFQEETFQDPVTGRVGYVPLSLADNTLASHYPFTSGLINGRGHKYHPSASRCDLLNNVTLSEFTTAAGQEYRLRVAVASAWHPFRISIQGHRMKVVATDGEDITTAHIREEVDYLIAESGERYDIVPVPMEASPEGAYWIVAETLEDPHQFHSRSYCPLAHRAYAILRYNSSDSEDAPTAMYNPLERDCTGESKCYAVNCPFQNYPHSYNITCINVDQFRAVSSSDAPDDSQMQSVFFNFQTIDTSEVHTNGINGRRFASPPLPLLTQQSEIPADWAFCKYPTQHSEHRGRQCTHTYTLQSLVTEMVLMNLGNEFANAGGHGHGHGEEGDVHEEPESHAGDGHDHTALHEGDAHNDTTAHTGNGTHSDHGGNHTHAGNETHSGHSGNHTHAGNETHSGHNDTSGHGDGHSGSPHVHGHPFHLHGYHFRVLKIGYARTEHGLYQADNADLNCSNPSCERGNFTWHARPNVTFNRLTPKKDTIFIPAGGYVIVRVIRNNPGFWLLHCHLAPHQQQGMGLVIVDGTRSVVLPPAQLPRCELEAAESANAVRSSAVSLLLCASLCLLALALDLF